VYSNSDMVRKEWKQNCYIECSIKITKGREKKDQDQNKEQEQLLMENTGKHSMNANGLNAPTKRDC
jgi:hypothetical protein